MAKANKRQTKEDPKIKCEYSGCVVMFGRNSERQRHVKEKHGSLIYCSIPGCRWTTRRMGRLRTHLDNFHRSKARINDPLPSGFRTATAQALESLPNHFSTPEANIDPNFALTPPFIYIDYAFRPQPQHSQPEASESYAALNGKEAPQLEYNAASGSSVALRRTVQVPPCRIFRPCRVRRRTSHTTTHISSMDLPLIHGGTAMEPALHSYPNEQDNPTASTQWMPDSFNAELMASFLCSLSLDYSIN